jgi:uncharacterized membrane protein YfcA
VRALLASPLGFLIGISLGLLGGGGSILAVPLLVYAAGQDARAATGTSLVVVAAVSCMGLVPHWRAGRVRVGAGVAFGVAGIAGSVVGSLANRRVDADVLLLGFALVMLAASAGMWRRAAQSVAPEPELGTSASGAVLTTRRITTTRVLRVAAAGTVVGLLTGFFGVGGGFVIVPALVLALGFPMPEAVGTSLLVIVINSLAALATRLGSGHLEWGVIVPFTIAGLLGVTVGSSLAHRIAPERLVRVFSLVLVTLAIFTAAHSLVAL